MPQTLKGRLFFFIISILVLSNSFIAFNSIFKINSYFSRQFLADSVLWGNILSEAAKMKLENGSDSLLEKFTQLRKTADTELKITIYDDHWWRVWGDESRFPLEGFPAKIAPDETIHVSGMPDETVREVFFPVKSGNSVIGSIGIGIPLSHSRIAWSLFQQTSIFSLVVLLLGVFATYLVSQNIFRPIGLIMDVIQSIREGDFSKRVEISGEDELSEMGEMFNLMVSSLQEKIREGRERNRTLDEKIQELWEIFELTKAMGFSLNLAAILNTFLEKAQTLSFSSIGRIILNDESKHPDDQSIPEISNFDFQKTLEECKKNAKTIEVSVSGTVILMMPLLSGRKVQGVLFLAKTGNQGYSEGVRRFLDTIAPLGGSLIENARLYQHVVEMKDYIRNILNSVDTGVGTVDKDNRLVTVNYAFRKIIGLDELDAFRQPLSEAFLDISDREFSKNVLQFISEKQIELEEVDASSIVRGEFPLNLSGTEPRVVQIRITPLKADDMIIGSVLIFDDLTSVRKMERHLVDVEKWVSLGRLAASIAHEIRNPLVSISSLVEVIGEEASEEHEKHIKVILGEVRRLNNFVEQLLNISRPERTKTRRVDLIETLKDFLLLIRHEASRQKVTISEKWQPAEAIALNVDPEKIKQAFLNVAINAIQAMPNGGTLEIAVLKHSDSVEISFQDHGTGIPKDLRDRLFDPFFTTKPHGTGLGLSITKRIIDLHNGTIKIDSAEGTGTNFTIKLPLPH
ncbi:MAG: HAMP domain-containing protein [Candidatus Riflebacteria bacterium]|nr:HAMP domain-containing protein [Candidatus Riflebacteria bacterium]